MSHARLLIASTDLVDLWRATHFAVSAMPLREPQVENAVKFLTNPKVLDAPLSQKLAFLQNKGLNEEEVAEALRRANAGGTSSAANGTSDETGAWGDTGTDTAPSSGVAQHLRQSQPQNAHAQAPPPQQQQQPTVVYAPVPTQPVPVTTPQPESPTRAHTSRTITHGRPSHPANHLSPHTRCWQLDSAG